MRINPDAAKIRDNKKNRHLFYIIPHFSCKIKIFIVSLQKEFMERGLLAKSYPENIGDLIMTEMNDRRLPVGIQSFAKIRREGYLYVDKTDMVWRLAHSNKTYHYLSRPRRFGKSILVDTLQAYFEGEKELFEGLKVMELEKEWTCYPVIRLDMSCGGATPEELNSYLDDAFYKLEQKYEVAVRPEVSLAVRFQNIIETIFQKTGKQTVILIDEYDSPLQHSWKTPEHDACTAIYKSVFAVLKKEDEHERFVFITGITKFTQISLFSVLNNLSNISFDAPYTTICGISKQEVAENFMPEIEAMGEENGWTPEETLKQLTAYYDGYHFCSDNMVDIFNPFSLINALSDRKLRNYWASSGATSLLPKFVDNMEMRMEYFDHCFIEGDTLETSDVVNGGAELFLYQSGYLTIKDYDDGVYILGFPNFEVRKALYRVVVPALTMKSNSEVVSAQSFLRKMMQDGNTAEAKKALKALIADVPYSNKKMASMDMEERYRLIMSTIFRALGFRVEVERMLATGRIDMIVEVPSFIYVLELKLSNNGGISAAESQIKEKSYTEPFKADKRKVIALAVELDEKGKGLTDWKEVAEDE